jgi:uncharacterized protein DUF6364
MAKTPTNLSVDPAVMERGRAYGKQHGTSVSQLVGDFLASLPIDQGELKLTRVVSKLHGIAARGRKRAASAEPIDAYRAHLDNKYGSK